MRIRTISFLLITLLLFLILAISCSDTGTESDPPNEPEDITETLNPFNAETQATITSATHYNDATDEKLGTGEIDVTGEENTSLPVRTEAADFDTTFTSITFNKEGEVNDIEMTPIQTDDPDSVDVTVNAEDQDSHETLGDLTISVDDSVVATEADSYTITAVKDTTLKITVDRDGFEPKSQSVAFNENKTVIFSLEKSAPKEIEIRYEIRDTDGDLINDSRFLADGSVIANGPQGSVTMEAANNTVEFCGQADNHDESCESKVADRDHDINLTLSRKTVSISITPQIVGYTDILRRENADSWPNTAVEHTVYTLTVGDSTWTVNLEAHDDFGDYLYYPFIAEGTTTTVEYPAGSEPVPVSIRAEYFPAEGHPYSDEHYLNVAEGETEVSGDTDSDIQMDLEHIPACRDGVNNDFDDAVDQDDTGCVDSDGNYDPDDDVELLKGWKASYGANSKGSSRLVSGAESQQETVVKPSHVPNLKPTIRIATVISVDIEILVSQNQAGEEFALEWHTGPDDSNLNTVNRTEISKDQGRDGWVFARFQDIDNSFFANGADFKVVAVHATKVRGESTTDGNDDVIFLKKGDSTTRAFVITWFYEPEEVDSGQKLKAQQYEVASPEGVHILREGPVEERQMDLK